MAQTLSANSSKTRETGESPPPASEGGALGALQQKSESALTHASDRIQAGWASTKEELRHLGEKSLDSTPRSAMESTNRYVHEHPWKAMSIAAGIAALLAWRVTR